jgi:hypothetical protein
MYTSHTKFGIGKIISENETTYTVYFEEIDAEKTPLKAFTKVYATIEDAENGLEMKIENEENKKAEEDKKFNEILLAGKAAQNRQEEINQEASKKLFKNI